LGPLPPERAAYLTDKVLTALAHAHRAGIVHCDMKPANVMVTEHGGVKIMDFGVSRVRGAGNPTTDGYMIGTPAYMPPEQVLGKQVDARADLYAIGVILYRLLTGTLPFKADTAIAMVQKQISEAPTPLHVYREDLPDWCDAIIKRALAKPPADRFQTAEEFRDALATAAGIVTTDLAKAFFTSVVDLEVRTPSPLGVLERFGVTTIGAAAAQTLHADDKPPAVSGSDSPTGNTKYATIVLRRKSLSPADIGVIATGVIAVIALVVLWRSSNNPMATAGVKPAAVTTESTTTKTPSANTEMTEPIDGAAPVETAPSDSASNSVDVPFSFEANALVPDGDRQRERESRVVLGDGTIHVRAIDDRKLLHAVPYATVVSISYSRGRNPLWNGPSGPAEVARASRGALGIFRGARHWLSVRMKGGRFVVLRLDTEPQAWSAIAKLEERTGRKALLVEERYDDR
jgi:serine/threonine protein kinase